MSVEATDRPDGAVEYFLDDLRSLRVTAGAPSYRALERATGLARSTLHDALNGSSLPALGTTITLVVTLGADPEPWRERWVSIRSGRATAAAEPELTEPEPEPEPEQPEPEPAGGADTERRDIAEPDGRRRRPHILVVIGIAVLLAGGCTWAVTALSRPTCTPVALYRLTADSRLLTANGGLVTRVSSGQLLVISSSDHGTYRYRIPARLVSTGQEGYVDQGKIGYVSGTCAEHPTGG